MDARPRLLPSMPLPARQPKELKIKNLMRHALLTSRGGLTLSEEWVSGGRKEVRGGNARKGGGNCGWHVK